jgi:flagellar brake protein
MHGHHDSAPDFTSHDTAEDGRYIIDNRMEVLAILRALKTRKALVAAYLEKAEDFILTALIAVHPESDEIVLDAGTRPQLNRSMLAEDRVTCITAQDGVKVRFTLHGVQRILFEGYEAFSAHMPASVLRVQRRDYYRVPAPATSAAQVHHTPAPEPEARHPLQN